MRNCGEKAKARAWNQKGFEGSETKVRGKVGQQLEGTLVQGRSWKWGWTEGGSGAVEGCKGKD